MKNKKTIFVVNGKGRSGKDYLCRKYAELAINKHGRYLGEAYRGNAKIVSSIEPQKQCLSDLINMFNRSILGSSKNQFNIEDNKDPEIRKLLSDMKRVSTKYGNVSFKYLLNMTDKFIEDRFTNIYKALFVFIREPEEIDEYINYVKDNLADKADIYSLLITSEKTDNIVYGNASDDGVKEYLYEYTFVNKYDQESVDRFNEFISSIVD